MKIIGITGKSGSGKTKFGTLLSEKLKCKYIDTDKVCHQAFFQPETIKILCDKFGTGILDEKGHVDRKKVGEIAFVQKDKMEVVVDLTWGYMQKEVDNILQQDDDIIILDGNLLPNSKYWDKCDYKILIKSDDDQRKQKIIERDNVSAEYLEKREAAGIEYSVFEFDYIFENDYKLETINKVIENIIEKI